MNDQTKRLRSTSVAQSPLYNVISAISSNAPFTTKLTAIEKQVEPANTSSQGPKRNQKGQHMETNCGTFTGLQCCETGYIRGEVISQVNMQAAVATDFYKVAKPLRTVDQRVSTSRRTIAQFLLMGACLLFIGATGVRAQNNARTQSREQESAPTPVQIVALDECDPTTFNAALGPNFCHNVTLGAFTVLTDLFKKAKAGTPDPNWDFEPDTLTIKKGTPIIVTDQGGEPHTFTEVERFGGGFIPDLNAPGETPVAECDGGFANLGVARTRILQGSQQQISGLGKGEHLFQCCIHPWMRVKVEVK
jgi:plastocyanin